MFSLVHPTLFHREQKRPREGRTSTLWHLQTLMAVGVEFCLSFLRSALKEGEPPATEWKVPWLQSAHNPGKLKIFLFGQVGLENRGISGWVLRPLTQNHPYSCLCVFKEHKTSYHSALVMKGWMHPLWAWDAVLRWFFPHCDRRGRKICSEYIRLFTFQKFPRQGFLRMQSAHRALWAGGCSSWVSGESRAFPSLTLMLPCTSLLWCWHHSVLSAGNFKNPKMDFRNKLWKFALDGAAPVNTLRDWVKSLIWMKERLVDVA